LADLNLGVKGWISYQSRDTEGTQTPLETLERGWGSCRDLAVLFDRSRSQFGIRSARRDRADHPRGNPENRMSDDELRRKFIDCAGTRMTSEQVDRVVETCLALETLDDIGALMPLLAVEQGA